MEWKLDIQVTEDPVHVDFLREAYLYAAENSNDKSTKNGSVLVKDDKIISYGCCGLPPCLEDLPERHERPLKYSYVTHAERDVIFNAAKEGISTDGSVLYCPWYACTDCAIAIISSGIERVVGHEDTFLKTPERWQESIDTAFKILAEAGVERLMYRGKIGGVTSLLNEEVWTP